MLSFPSMLTISGAILLVLGILVTIVVVVRSVPRLAVLHLPPRVRSHEVRLKERILFERMLRQLRAMGDRITRMVQPIARRWGSALREGSRRLRLRAQEFTIVKPGRGAATCAERVAVAQDAIAREEYDRAEEVLLACLKVDPKHRAAYLGLSALYRARRELSLAEETLRFLRKLAPADAEVAYLLAGVLRERGETASAFVEVGVAVMVEPRNPKYLDAALELAIVERDARRATRYLAQLREANPENQKLTEFAERIAEIDGA